MSDSVRRHQLSFSGILGVGLLVMLLGISLGAEPATPPKEITNPIGMKLVLIPAGKFVMGSPKDEVGRQYREDQHEVEITKPFYMGVHTVTCGQFRQFVQAAGYQTDAEQGDGGLGYNAETKRFEGRKPEYNWQNPGFKQTDDHPVTNVTWNDAMAFCDWLSKKEGKKYCLPTEAEWEYACRAGTTTRFYSGDHDENLKGVANIADASLRQKVIRFMGSGWGERWDDGYPFTSPVGSFKPNAFGLYDMHGNVWQWCSDWYDEDYYKKSPGKDPQGPDPCVFRVIRGGSFDCEASRCRSAFRAGVAPTSRLFFYGFRVVMVQQ